MTSGVPWQVEDIPQQARETALEAARRSGMSVGEWLDSVISDCAIQANRHPSPADVPPRAPTQGLSHLEEQLRQVATRIETLQPCAISEAMESLRDDLAEISLMLKQAMPRQSIEALEIEVRGLCERLRLIRQPDGGDAATAGLERGLAEIRDALRALTPAENLVGVDETVRELSRKVDLIACNAQEPAALEHLEGAIVALRGIAAQVASDAALAKLSDEVSGLAVNVEQLTSSAELLSTLEHRISSMAAALESHPQVGVTVPNDLDAIVKGLADRLERLGFTRSEPAAVGQLEDRIANLVEKLDTSNARLSHLDTIETALSDLLIFLERQPPSPEVTSLRQDVQETRNSLETVQGAVEQLIHRLAIIENDIGGGNAEPAADAAAVAAAAVPAASPLVSARATFPAAAVSPVPTRRAAERDPAPPAQHEHRPIDPNLPPDHPLEPGTMRAHGGSSPLDRIAASEVALGPIKPPTIPDPGNKANFIAAARRAARAANSESAGRDDKPAPAGNEAPEGKAASGWRNRTRSLLVAMSAILVVAGPLYLVASQFGSAREPGESRSQETRSSQGDEAETPVAADDLAAPGPRMPGAPVPGRQSLFLPLDSQTWVSTPASSAVTAEKDVTGSLARPVPTMPAGEAASAPPRGAGVTKGDKLPGTIGGALRAAAAEGDPAAEYEIGLRYSEGRGMPQNLAEAADWFDRAAKQGLAPAQFRLGGFYEKGFGVKKDLDAARRLYSAAAEAGNATAMHNLAVLYSEGIDGKPDYRNAAKWFRKAADYGLSDSQYNLGILYGRGIGVEPDLAEAYKWFTLAAREGDKESAAKRDQVGGRLDRQSLAAAKLAAESWTPREQPRAATQAAIPAGGWDKLAAPPPGNPKPRDSGPNPGPVSDLSAASAAR